MPIRRGIQMAIALFLLSALLSRVSEARAEFPTLARAVELARAHAIVVAEARGELGFAEAQTLGARVSSLGNPYTDIQIDRGIGELTSVQALTYSYFPLDIAGQRGTRVDEADRLLDWRKVGVDDARAMAAGGVVCAYGEVAIEASRVSEAATGERAAREEASYFAGRLEAKDTTIYEMSLADAEIARWVQAGAEAQLRLTSAGARFAELTGMVAIEFSSSTPDVSPPPLRGSWDDAQVVRFVDRAPILARLDAERRYWQASLERYEREQVPPVALELIVGRGSQGETRLGAGAVVTLPITRRYQGEIARAEGGRDSATDRIALYRNVVEARLRAARDAMGTVRKTLEELDRNGLPALERAVNATMQAFKAGKIDLSRTLLARRDLAIARTRRLDMLEAGWRAYADLVALSGELP